MPSQLFFTLVWPVLVKLSACTKPFLSQVLCVVLTPRLSAHTSSTILLALRIASSYHTMGHCTLSGLSLNVVAVCWEGTEGESGALWAVSHVP